MKVLSLLFGVLFSLCSLVQAASPKKVLILYDQGADKRQPALTDARYLSNLIGHFNASVRLMPVQEYKPGSMAANNVTFYITYEKTGFSLPSAFTSDFYNNRKTFCWINHQLGQLNQELLAKTYGFHFKEYREDLAYNKVVYKKVTFPKGDENMNIVAVDNPSAVTVVARALSAKGGEELPYILKSRNLWFVADSPFSYASERDRYIVFGDVLHDIMDEDHQASHTALIRIEDINPMSDGAALLKMARFLHSKDVPFAVGLVPVYIDSAKKTEWHLEDNPALLSALKKIPSLGGTFVLHGYTHQYHGITTDDYEFWDDVADKPIRGDSVDNTSLRIERGLKELFANGIYPFAWETPHYFGSRNTYNAVKKYFSISYERRGTMPYLGSDQFFPYVIKDMYGQTNIPENLGYVSIDNPDPQPIIDAARLNLAVRDGYASFFFHPFIEMKHLRKIVNGIKDMGYTFRDIKSFAPQVQARDKVIVTKDSDVRIDTRDNYVSVRQFDFNGTEKAKSILPHAPEQPYAAHLQCPAGSYIVVQGQEAPEPGLLKRIWHLAKIDLSYLKGKTMKKKTSGKITKIMHIAFVTPLAKQSGENLNDLKALQFSLSVAGVKYVPVTTAELLTQDLREYDIIVMPYAAAKELKEPELQAVKEAVNSGSSLLFDGPSKLAETLGIEVQQEPITVRRIRDTQFPDVPLFWPSAVPVQPVCKSEEREYRVLSVDEDTDLPISVGGSFGKGKYIYLAALFDPYTDRGYSRFPFLLEMMGTIFDYTPVAERRALEMYFDPGLRQYISVEKLAQMWRRHGITRIYAGGWHFYEKYTYDYARLIRVCHENGILVYCWLEPPMVNQKFWDRYPEWREKTAVLKDAKISWRSLMNVANPDCRKKVFDELETLLMSYDWDGVNLAELYFESAAGPDYPENFTPMNDTVRKEFKKNSGIDPIDFFNPSSPHYWKTSPAEWQWFIAYRKQLSYRLKAHYLDFLSGIQKKKKDLEIVLTAIDVTATPKLSDLIAEDTDKLIALQKKYGITLQVEDPAIMWSGKPERYAALGDYYRKFIKDPTKLILDCNVLESHRFGAGGVACEKPSGEEIRQITYNMDLSGSRAAFYSENTVFENDYHNIGAVLARKAEVTEVSETEWQVRSPSSVSVLTGKRDLITHLDGELWFAGDGESVIVPAGEHTLSFENEPRYFDMSSLKPRLRFISSDLQWANFSNNAIEFGYVGDAAPTYIILNKRPRRIYVDDKKTSCTVLKSEHGFSVRLPSGTHAVKIQVGGGFDSLVETSGVILLSLIIIFGFFTSITFLGLFIAIQIKRKIVS